MIWLCFIGVLAAFSLLVFLVYRMAKEPEMLVAVLLSSVLLFIAICKTIELCEIQGVEKFVNGEYSVEPHVKAVKVIKNENQ